MAPLTTQQMRQKAPHGILKLVFKGQNPHFPTEAWGDLLVHLNCLLFIRQIAKDSRANACENKCRIITRIIFWQHANKVKLACSVFSVI
uniref:Uncharacterized protein n=1 Tax=Castor canadensis TaxID=51338 RepID=A0A8C0XKT8_CASCN